MPPHSLDSLIFTPADFERYNGHHQLETFELPRSLDDQKRDTSSTSISTAPVNSTSSQDIVQWLREPGTQKVHPNDPSMKILLIQTQNQSTVKKPPSLSFARPLKSLDLGRPQTSERVKQVEFIKDVFSGMGLPLAAFGAYIKAHITFVCVPASSTSKTCKNATQTTVSACTKYYCSGTSWTITWSYCPTLRHTAAVMFHREGDGDERREEVLAKLLRLQTHLAHPMLLGYIKTKVSLSFTFEMLDDMNRETLALEQDIGFPTWNWVLDRMVPGTGVGENHDHAVEGFNLLAGKLTNIRFRLRTFQQQIKFISRCNAKYRQSLESSSSSNSTNANDHLIRECEELDAFMDVIWDYTFVHLFDADSLSERLHNAMTSVFQLTTQRDSRASLAIADFNHELARQGKNTNTSMMTIAFVSLLFLPGTFVASFFDTPIFNFPLPGSDGGNSHSIIVTQPFWIYWTVSGMLTLILSIGWVSYLRRRRALDNREREGESVLFRERIGRKNKERGFPGFVDQLLPSTALNSRSSNDPDYRAFKSDFPHLHHHHYGHLPALDGGGRYSRFNFRSATGAGITPFGRTDIYGAGVRSTAWQGNY